jgi:hypothetical protein
LKSLGPVKVKFAIEVNQPLRMLHHGIAIYNAENQLMWGTATNIASLEPGVFEFVYDLAVLPLKPGAYRWRVSLYDEHKLQDVWDCSPDLLIDTEHYGHVYDEWAGLLNVPNQFSINGEDASRAQGSGQSRRPVDVGVGVTRPPGGGQGAVAEGGDRFPEAFRIL